MKRLHLVLILALIVAADTVLAVYAFSYSTDTLSPATLEVEGVTVIDRSLNGLLYIGTEDGRIITPASTYQNEARITSLITTDDGQIVIFADGIHRVQLYMPSVSLLVWTRSFDRPVEVSEVWARQGPLFLEPTHILVNQEDGFHLLRGSDGATLWSHEPDAPFVIQPTEVGKIIEGSGSRVNFFWLGDAEPYRWIPVEGPAFDIVSDAGGLTFLLVKPNEVLLYDSITGEVLWRRSVRTATQTALSWDGEESYLLSYGHLEIVAKSGETLASQDIGVGRLLVPSASSHYFILRNDRIDAYRSGRPAPVWTAYLVSAYEVYSTEGGNLLYAWTSDRVFVLENTDPVIASSVWMGVFGTVILVQVLAVSIAFLKGYPLPSLSDLVIALFVGAAVGVGSLFSGALAGFVELNTAGAFLAAMSTATAAALFGRKSASAFAGATIGLAVGAIGFLTGSVLVAFCLYVFEVFPTFPAIAVAVRSLTLGWLLGLVGGSLGGLSANLVPGSRRSAISRT